MNQVYKGSCFCGAVEITVTGEPAAAGYCHCASCRSWSAAPVNAFSLWKPESVKVTKGEGNIGIYHKTERSYRKFCKACGGHLMTDHPMLEPGRRLRRDDPDVPPPAGAARALRRNGASHQGRPAEAEGHAEGDGRLGRGGAGVAAAAPGVKASGCAASC